MKHLIKSSTTPHGSIGWRHKGKDGQYAEAGDKVRLDWQPDAGWGLQEAHYTDDNGNVTSIEGGVFVMPDKAITIGGSFRRFVLPDWTGEKAPFTIVGSFAPTELPRLAFKDAGKLAYDTENRRYVTWNGFEWVTMTGEMVAPRYLTFTAVNGAASVAFMQDIAAASDDFPALDINMEYSVDGGETWSPYLVSKEQDIEDPQPNLVNLTEGGSVMFRGTNEQVSNYDVDNSDEGCYLLFHIASGQVAATGSLTSILNGDGASMALTHHAEFYSMFNGCTGLTSLPSDLLPATTLASSCYYYMFSGCTGLTSLPSDLLPATTLASSCYSSMFRGCTGLTSLPSDLLPATTLASSCYYYMFSGCTGLTSLPSDLLPATTLAEYCYNSMFNGCTGLTSLPSDLLPATTLVPNCYHYMFRGCTGIKLATSQAGVYQTQFRIPTEGTGTSATNALQNMFQNTGGSFKGTPTINTTYYMA